MFLYRWFSVFGNTFLQEKEIFNRRVVTLLWNSQDVLFLCHSSVNKSERKWSEEYPLSTPESSTRFLDQLSELTLILYIVAFAVWLFWQQQTINYWKLEYIKELFLEYKTMLIFKSSKMGSIKSISEEYCIVVSKAPTWCLCALIND